MTTNVLYLADYATVEQPDLADHLQRAVDDARTQQVTLQLPKGKITLKDTLHIGRGILSDPGPPHLLSTCRIVGCSPAVEPTEGTILYAPFTDRPAVNFQCSPFAVLEFVQILGANVGFPAHAQFPHPSRVQADWYAPGLLPKRFAPYAGISVNAFGDTFPSSLPGERYPNQPNEAVGNGGAIELGRGVIISNFEVGLVVNPNGSGAGTGNGVYVHPLVSIGNCVYGIVVCDPNGRNVVIDTCPIVQCHTAYSNHAYGAGAGYPALINGGEWNTCYQLVDIAGGIGSHSIRGVSTESVHRIGRVCGGGTPTVFDACTFYAGLVGGVEAGAEAIHLVADGAVEIRNSTLYQHTEQGIFNIVGAGSVTFRKCTFTGPDASVPRDYIIGTGYPASGSVKFEDCIVANVAGGGPYLSHNGGRMLSPAETWDTDSFPPWRVSLNLSATAVTLLVQGPAARLSVDPGSRGWVGTSWSGLSWNETTKRVYFTAASPGEYLVGDILLAKPKATAIGLVSPRGAPFINAVSRFIPALRVVGVNGTQVVAAAIFAWGDLDQTITDQPMLAIVADTWAPNRPLTGNWAAGSSELTTSLDPALYVRPGDFVRGNGLQENTRVLSAVGFTLTISKPTASAGSNEPLWYGRLLPIEGTVGSEPTIGRLRPAIYIDGSRGNRPYMLDEVTGTFVYLALT